MQLTLYTDYSLRTLIYLALHANRTVTVTELADFYDISRNHLVKVVHNLSSKHFVHSTRGKGGGLRLARPAYEINVGDVVRQTEPNFYVVECFNPDADPCVIDATCGLKSVLNRATLNFLSELDRYTIADFVRSPVSTPTEFKIALPIKSRKKL